MLKGSPNNFKIYMTAENKQDQEKVPKVNRQGWNVDELTKESTNKSSDEMLREVLRGGETGENADNRDTVGSVKSEDTPQGREESKKEETKNHL